jgi:glycosyltransferase involved in cell wall biosynthesis
MRRLLYITPIFPADAEDDSAVPFLTHFCENSAENEIQIDIISLMYPFTTGSYQFGKLIVHPIGGGFKRSYKKIPLLLKAIWKGIHLVRKHKYDGILCFWYREAALVGKIINVFSRTKFIVWMLGQDIKPENRYIRWLRIPAQQIIMLSGQQRDLFFKYHRLDVAQIANVCVDKKRFPPLHTDDRGLTILGVGNLGALKNYSLFIAVVHLLKPNYPNLKAVLCGDGEERQMLEQKAAVLGLSETLSFTGILSHPEVLEVMNHTNVFLHTSQFEGGGTVLQEALYSGCQVVSTIAVAKDKPVANFHHATTPEDLAAAVTVAFKSNKPIQRSEPFAMEDTVKVIFNAFYGSDS